MRRSLGLLCVDDVLEVYFRFEVIGPESSAKMDISGGAPKFRVLSSRGGLADNLR